MGAHDQEKNGEEIRWRIQSDINHFNGSLPEHYAYAWSGYIAAALEWQIISLAHFDDLLQLLPKLSDSEVLDSIFLGRED